MERALTFDVERRFVGGVERVFAEPADAVVAPAGRRSRRVERAAARTYGPPTGCLTNLRLRDIPAWGSRTEAVTVSTTNRCPCFGRPSQPMKGLSAQHTFFSMAARRTPIAMESFWALTREGLVL
jgi:hypothetical protein